MINYLFGEIKYTEIPKRSVSACAHVHVCVGVVRVWWCVMLGMCWVIERMCVCDETNKVNHKTGQRRPGQSKETTDPTSVC